MDIWVDMEKTNAEKVVSALKSLGFDLTSLTPALFLKEDQIIRMGNPPYRIEISTTISGVLLKIVIQIALLQTLAGLKLPSST